MAFDDEETQYLRSQPLTRIATVSSDGQPDVVPVGFEFDGTYIYVGGHGEPEKTRKFRNVASGNPKVALIFDDLVSVDPWTARSLRVYGTAEVVEGEGMFGSGPYLRITPRLSWSFNLEGRPVAEVSAAPRRTVH
jgi:pyridoxamine 5'-phosphate oxidase family protein